MTPRNTRGGRPGPRQYSTGTSPTARLGGDGYVGASSARSVYGTPPKAGRRFETAPPDRLPDSNAERLAALRRRPEDNRTPGTEPGSVRAGPGNGPRGWDSPGQGPGAFTRGRAGMPGMMGVGGPSIPQRVGPGARQRTGSAKKP